MRNPPINEARLIAALRQHGEYFIAINLGDIVRRLNEKDSKCLEEFTANRLSEYAEELAQSDDSNARELGAKLKTFVETYAAL